MEGEPGNNWQPTYVNSPTGSVDSGVELSPTRAITYGTFDECYGRMCNDGRCPESPAFPSGSSHVGEGNLGCRASLTQEELDTLSDCDAFSPSPGDQQASVTDLTEIALSDAFSPSPGDQEASVTGLTEIALSTAFSPTPGDQQASVTGLTEIALSAAFSPSPGDQQASVTDLTEIGHINFQQQTPAENLRELLVKNDSQGRSVNTRKRKHTEKDCFVPKTGTAKPRQNHKKRKNRSTESMAGGQVLAVMNSKKFYTGARVKVTARERLQWIRDEEPEHKGGAESRSRMSSQVAVRNVNHRPPARRHAAATNKAGTSYDISYPVSQAQGIIPHTARPWNMILSPQSRVYHSLEILLEEAIERGNSNPLGAYAQQQSNVRCSVSGQTALLHILKRLAELKDRFPAHEVKTVTKFLCKILPDSINTQNYQGETPIYQAARYGNEGAVQALMEEGADPWKQESSAGETALHAAVRSKKLSIVNAILCGVKSRYPSFAAGINIRSCDGNTPLHKAAELCDVGPDIQRKIVTALLESHADPSIKNNQSQMAHSFLPGSLKELQVYMKRHNGRKNRNMAQRSTVVQGDLSPYCHGQALQSQYARHFTPDMIQANHIAPRNQLDYGNLPQALPASPATTQPPIAQFDPQYAPLYYVNPRTPITNVILPLTNPDEHAEEFDDLNFNLPSF